MTHSKSKGVENHWTFYGFQFIGCNQDANNTNFDVWWGLPVCQALLSSLYMLHTISIYSYTNVYIHYILATYIHHIYHSMRLLDNISIKQNYVRTRNQAILEGWCTLQRRKPRHSKVALTCTASEWQSSSWNSGSLTPEPMLAHCTSAASTLGWALCHVKASELNKPLNEATALEEFTVWWLRQTRNYSKAGQGWLSWVSIMIGIASLGWIPG